MDGGEGPPMLREGCKVIRGLDWDETGSGAINMQEDGKEIYEKEKATREKEKSLQETNKEKTRVSPEDLDPKDVLDEDKQISESDCQVEEALNSGAEQPSHAALSKDSKFPEENTSSCSLKQKDDKKRKKKLPSPRLPIGTVLSIDSWDGIPALGRR